MLTEGVVTRKEQLVMERTNVGIQTEALIVADQSAQAEILKQDFEYQDMKVYYQSYEHLASPSKE